MHSFEKYFNIISEGSQSVIRSGYICILFLKTYKVVKLRVSTNDPS